MIHIFTAHRALTFAAALCAAAALATSAAAERKPRPSTAPDPQMLLEMHSGKTWDWSKGGAYFAPDGSFQAIWEQSVADGKWYVTTRGNICYDAVWYGRKDDGTVGASEVSRCWQNVLDKDGQLWQRNQEENRWYKMGLDSHDAGNKIRSEVRKRLADLRG